MLTPGQKSPPLRLPSTSGGHLDLADLRGRKVVVYFYPRDDTPGCTRESCDFRDHLGRLRAAGAEVLGVSRDSLASHGRFREKYELPFELLSDEGSAAARAWGAFGVKTMYGKKVEGTIRSTFLVDEQGRIERVWSPVKVDGHVDAVLAALGAGEKSPAAGKPRAAGKSAKKAAPRPARNTKKAPAKKAASKSTSASKAPAKKARK